MVELKIQFESKEAAEHFGTWLCEQGEQSYWKWMDCRECEEKGNITATEFHYHHPEDERYSKSDEKRYENAKFLNDLTIKTTCGRLDESECHYCRKVFPKDEVPYKKIDARWAEMLEMDENLEVRCCKDCDPPNTYLP